MTHVDTDVAILGGGLAGLSLAHQLARARPGLRITVLEKATFPVPEAAHKVGESTVEIAALYFGRTLGLRDLIEEQHLAKFGLRFFFDDGDNRDITRRGEFGPSIYMPVRSWQIDRGRFENALAGRCAGQGIRLVQGAAIRHVGLGTPHTVTWREGDVSHSLTATWVVDTTGRRQLLKKQLGLNKKVPHDINAAWFRVSANIDIDTWSDDPAWLARIRSARRPSTNHLMGQGYWVWLIPLPGGGTSVGVVADARQHSFSSLRTPEAVRTWLAQHEPQCAQAVAATAGFDDFLVLKRYAHGASRVFSPDRWALVGDAGIFLDPFYSPGSDFIGIANTMLTEGILADLDGQPDAASRIEGWNRRLLLMFRAFLPNYRGRYTLMGAAVPMRAKITWDISTYWATYALMFASGRLEDERFMARCDAFLRDLFVLNVEVQELLSRWGEAEQAAGTAHDGAHFYDYASQDWLRALNGRLMDTFTDETLLAQLQTNLAQQREVAAELQAIALARHPDLVPIPDSLPTPTRERLTWLGMAPGVPCA